MKVVIDILLFCLVARGDEKMREGNGIFSYTSENHESVRVMQLFNKM